MSINICDLCYELTAVSCYGLINLEVGLDANTSYTVFIQDKFVNYYTETIISDGIGSLLLNLDNFPDGLFTPFSGYYTISVSTNSLNNTFEDLTLEGETYSCIKAKFIDVD